MEAEIELKKLIMAVVTTLASLSYCHHIAAKTPKGLPRLLAVLPVITLLFVIPFKLHTVNLGAPLVLLLSWLTNFNLLAFAFDHGPLSPPPPSTVAARHVFILAACCPFRIKQPHNSKAPLTLIPEAARKASLWLVLSFVSHHYKHCFHKHVCSVLFGFQIWVAVEFIFTMGAILAQMVLRVELEPQFKSPHFSSSLQDFWGHRWNLRVSDTLRVVVYDPIRSVSIRVIGARWGSLPAVFVTFVTSGLMHELVYYNILRENPTWEITWFFVLQGILVDMEIVLKKKVKFRVHRAISGPLALANLTACSVWLALAPLLRSRVDERIIDEFNLFLDCFLGLIHKI